MINNNLFDVSRFVIDCWIIDSQTMNPLISSNSPISTLISASSQLESLPLLIRRLPIALLSNLQAAAISDNVVTTLFACIKQLELDDEKKNKLAITYVPTGTSLFSGKDYDYHSSNDSNGLESTIDIIKSATTSSSSSSLSSSTSSLLSSTSYQELELPKQISSLVDIDRSSLQWIRVQPSDSVCSTVSLYSTENELLHSLPALLAFTNHSNNLNIVTIFKKSTTTSTSPTSSLNQQQENIKKLGSPLCIIYNNQLQQHQQSIVGKEERIVNQINNNNQLIINSISFDINQLLSIFKIDTNESKNIEIIENDKKIILLIEDSIVGVIGVKQLDCNSIVLYAERKFTISKYQKLVPEQRLIKMVDKWIFTLDKENSIISIFSVSGRQRALINLKDYLIQNNNNIDLNDIKFNDFSISSDKSTLVIKDENDRIYMIMLDYYFQTTSQPIFSSSHMVEFKDKSTTNQEEEEQEEEEEEEEEEKDQEESSESLSDSEDSIISSDLDDSSDDDLFLMHWFETKGSGRLLKDTQKEFDSVISWLPNRSINYPTNGFKVNKNQTKTMSRENSFNSMIRSSSFADLLQQQQQQQFNNEDGQLQQQQQQLNQSQSIQSSTSLFNYKSNREDQLKLWGTTIDYQIEKRLDILSSNFLITPRVIIYQRSLKEKSEIYLFDRNDPVKKQFYHSIPEKITRVFYGKDQNLFYLCSSGLNILLVDQNQQQLLNNLIMFEGSNSANHLCDLNGWNKRDLKIHALHLGLKYRQLEVVEPALKSLDHDQQLAGSRLLVHTILENTAVSSNANVHNESFTTELLHIGMNFIGLIIKDRASKLDDQKNQGGISTFNWTETLTTPLLPATAVNASSTPNTNILLSILSPSQQPTLLALQDENSKNSPIHDLLHFTTILEAFRMFQWQQQVDKSQDNLYQQQYQQQQQQQTVQLYDSVNDQITDLEIGNLFFKDVKDRWSKMEELQIIKESLNNNTITTALSFINWKREKNKQQEITNNQQDDEDDDIISLKGKMFTLEDFKRIAVCFIYQTISQEEMDMTIKLLNNLGLSVIENLKQITLTTSRRNIRKLGLDTLGQSGGNRFYDRDLIEFSNLLERLYPNPSYFREYSKLSFKWRPMMETRQPLLFNQLLNYQNNNNILIEEERLKSTCQEVDDLLAKTQDLYGFQILNHNINNSNNATLNIYNSGLLGSMPTVGNNNNLLNNINNSNNNDRIIINPPNIQQQMVNDHHSMSYDGYSHFTLEWLKKWSNITRERILLEKNHQLNERDVVAQFLYFASHVKIEPLLQLIDHLEGDQLQQIIKVLKQMIKLLPNFLREIILSRFLIRHHIVLVECESSGLFYLESKHQDKENNLRILYRLATTNQLFNRDLRGDIMVKFHPFFIQFCIENNLTLLLSSYLEFYDLEKNQKNRSEQDRLLKLPLPIQLLFLLRSHRIEDLVESNLINNSMVLGKNLGLVRDLDQFTLMINHSIDQNRPLLALSSILYSPIQFKNLNHLNQRLFNQLEIDYPFLKTSLSPKNPNNNNNMNRRDIISNQNDISLFELINNNSLFNIQNLLNNSKLELLSNQSFREGYIDKIDIFYYLDHGRPFTAFKVFNQQKQKQKDLGEYSNILIGWLIRQFIISQKLQNQKTIVASLEFLDLLGLSRFSTILRCDLNILQQLQSSNELIELFLSIYQYPSSMINNNFNSIAIQKIIQLFFETLSMDEPLIVGETLQWQLLSKFCDAHGVEKQTKHLEYLAFKNNWIRFIFEIQSQSFELQQVEKIIQLFGNDDIRNHLIIIFQQIQKTRDNNELKSQDDSIFNYLIESIDSNSGKEYLLNQSINDNRPLLSILANSIDSNENISTIQCFIIWLNREINNINNNNNNNDYSIENIIILQGFKIFYPNCILFNFLTFILQFQQYRFEESEQSLLLFIRDLENDQIQSNFPIEKSLVKKQSIHICEKILDVLSIYEREHFLEILSRSNLDENFSTLFSTFSLLKRNQQQQSFEFNVNPKLIVEQLLTKSMFEEARQYSMENHLDKDVVTIAEVESLVNHYKQGCLWEIEQERINLWKKCQHYFTLYQTEPQVAGNFYYSHAIKLFNSNEKVYLLSLTIEWFEKMNIQNDQEFKLLLEDLKKQILLISVGLSLENDKKQNSSNNNNNNGNLLYSNSNSNSNSVSPLSSPFKPPNGTSTLNYSTNNYFRSPSSSLSSSPTESFNFNNFSSPFKPRNINNINNNNNNNREESIIENNYLSSHPLNNLKEEKDNNFSNPKGLDNVLAKLLNNGNYSQAMEISKQFNFKSIDYEIIFFMLSVASKKIAPLPTFIPSNILTIVQQNFNGIKWLNELQQQQQQQQLSMSQNLSDNSLILNLLDILCSCCQTTTSAAKTIITKFNVCQTLFMDFNDPQLDNHYDILNLLLLSGGKDSFRLVKQFIILNHLNFSIVNQQLVDLFLKSLNQNNNQSNWSLSSSSNSNSFDSKIDINWTSEEFHEYIRLGKDPFTFGMKLLESLDIDVEKYQSTNSPIISGENSSSSSSSSDAISVEIFIRAHFCFVIGCSVDGTIMVLNIVKSRIQYYASKGEYKLLVRLVTGMQSYNELQGILDILLQHDQFELLLRKKIHQHEDHNGLKLALHSYLLKKQPLYQEKLEMLFLRFKMYREIAASHEHKAKQLLESLNIPPSKELSKPSSPIAQQYIKDLLNIMREFMDASDNYAKERSNKTSQVCVSMGILVAAQIKNLDIRILNLKQSDARLLMQSRGNFRDGLIIANAYNLNNYTEWLNVIFNQFLVLANFNYLSDYLNNFSSNINLYHDLIKKYKSNSPENQILIKSVKVLNVKHLLNHFVLDRTMRYELAMICQFDDIVQSNKSLVK
ncbi:hypothetical protein DFA_05713 [Cavenderia fasciculata]|uniref:Spatacsin C-terminal domain-containing protein n=1 Tax=Cavenderia fasciculata TaxID=261658 RepID=F4PM80_CACFS|nr:uncharacterized protein DFA_05713 [Cavenderia fasciculata]EGG23580.1 hypothetical protein DFA_05713 [Cavenderia fasciculata]|eukprot:XP_004361431.1 hypothetical protein DFA_05713 [Cavenderia fasciculata]